MTDRGKSIFDGDTGIMVGIGNNITATDETIDCCAANLIDTSVLEVHIQGITFSNMAARWFFTKNAALYGAIVGNGYKRAIFNRATGFIEYGMEKFSTSDRTMIYEGRGRRKKITATDFSAICHSVVEISPNNGCISSNREFTFGDISSAGNN